MNNHSYIIMNGELYHKGSFEVKDHKYIYKKLKPDGTYRYYYKLPEKTHRGNQGIRGTKYGKYKTIDGNHTLTYKKGDKSEYWEGTSATNNDLWSHTEITEGKVERKIDELVEKGKDFIKKLFK